MSRSNTDADDEPSDRIDQRTRQLDEFAGDLNAQGYADLRVLRRENGRDVLTESRLELVSYLDRHGEEVRSVSELARMLERDKITWYANTFTEYRFKLRTP